MAHAIFCIHPKPIESSNRAPKSDGLETITRLFLNQPRIAASQHQSARNIMAVDILATVFTAVGGALVLLTYVAVFRNYTQGYMSATHPFWLGYSAPTIRMLVLFQLAAVVGFFLFAIPWLFIEQPQGGVLSHPAALALTLGVFMLASAAWAPSMQRALLTRSLAWKLTSCVVLWAAAASSIVLVAGAAEETRPRWYVMLGVILFAATTVLADGVAYTARTITTVK